MGQRLHFEAIKLNFTQTKPVAAALQRLGRTEDVKFSPSGKKLAIADYGNNKLLIIDLSAKSASKNTTVVASDFLEVTSSELKLPHGISWINDSALLVANRIGLVCILQLPQKKPASRSVDLSPMATVSKAELPLFKNPGSVTVTELSKNCYEILVCSFSTNLISRHVLNTENGFTLSDHSIFLKSNVITPDGIVRSASGRYLAVSNHRGQHVSVYDCAIPLDDKCLPIATLSGLGFPHGLQFSKDEKFIFVADAGQPFVHVYFNGEKNWTGEIKPVAAIRILDDEAFIRGNVNAADGGSKGIGLSRDNHILAVTCQEEPLTFYDIRPLLKIKKFPIFIKPDFPQLPPKPPKGFLLRAWKFCRRKLKQG